MKTRNEVEKLKSEWLSDACWDIEDTEGFEEYKPELLQYRLMCDARRNRECEQKKSDMRNKLDCNEEMRMYLLMFEQRIEKLELLCSEQQ